MFPYLIKRIGMATATLFVIMLVSYLLIRAAPGDPTKSTFLGENSADTSGLSADKSAFAKNTSLREKLHLDKHPMIGFAYWIKGIILHGDFGDSASVDKGRPVTQLILERLPVTLTLNVCSILFVYIISIQIGIHSAVSKKPGLDNLITVILFLLYSLMNVWVALLLQWLFCKGGVFPIFPLKGLTVSSTWGKSTWQIMFETASHYVLPVFCLSYAALAGLSRYARSGMLEVVNQDYIRTARAKGLPEHTVIFKHALRNAMIILITLFAGLLPGLVAGSILIEHIFNIPGMGSLSMMALSSRDIPLLMTLFAFGSFLTLAGILVADFLYVLVDPRISFEGRK
jgi:peptide/nickel transport system permease protein